MATMCEFSTSALPAGVNEDWKDPRAWARGGRLRAHRVLGGEPSVGQGAHGAIAAVDEGDRLRTAQ
eukprot:scaffold19897_cov103-Isochrysis_galbana.AAC.1